ncbi:sulfotransferase domain-containing protein [Pontixanthobacter sp.]|uniref:sulfotransferase domain-containing protein n=1 Tax=Pontixanthobacter sp. TaxID=2792078 RepID=UPI003C7D4653
MSRGNINWLASYPKSGNTWLRLLLASYFNENAGAVGINTPNISDGISSARKRFDEITGISSSDLTLDEVRALQPDFFNALSARRRAPMWIKAHDAQMTLDSGTALFPASASAAALYLVRNPLDVAVSLAFHDGHENMDRAIRKMGNPAATLAGGKDVQLPQIINSWSGHVISWADQTEIPVLVLRYEDFIADTGACLTRAIAFARPTVLIDPVRIRKAVNDNTFEALQSAEQAEPFRERPPRAKRFFRKGICGDWRNHLSASQVQRICDDHGPVMHRFGYSTATGDAQ